MCACSCLPVAPPALLAAGAQVVVAESYARIFFRNCMSTGELYPVETDERLCDVLNTGAAPPGRARPHLLLRALHMCSRTLCSRVLCANAACIHARGAHPKHLFLIARGCVSAPNPRCGRRLSRLRRRRRDCGHGGQRADQPHQRQELPAQGAGRRERGGTAHCLLSAAAANRRSSQRQCLQMGAAVAAAVPQCSAAAGHFAEPPARLCWLRSLCRRGR